VTAPAIALAIDHVSHRYGDRVALDGITMEVPAGQIFGMLGPNGSGKSTLFRLISTLVPIQSGRIEVFGRDVARETSAVRNFLGVVFQSPSLDRKLTVLENMQCQAALYGIAGAERQRRILELSKMMGLEDRLNDRCEGLSGGLKRRAELAKGLLHRPSLMVLDEPSTGLDPSARLELWQALVGLRDHWGTTVLLTTHLMEEADKCDCLAILDEGKLVALASPQALRQETGELVVSVSSREPLEVAHVLKERFGWDCATSGEMVRAVTNDSAQRFAEVFEALGTRALSVTVGRPGLEDVFMRKTGRIFSDS
jgi:ABC-2 type transport system ATP-binding protein